MPKGPKSIKVMCAELGMDAGAEMMFRKDVLHFLQRQISDLPNASDDTIEPVAWEFLDTGGGAKHFSWDAALNYQWEAGEHRMTISQYVSDIMKMQRWYAIDRLHHRIDGAAKCPGCLVHPPKEMTPEFPYGSTHANHRVDNIVITSDVSDAGSIHHITSRESTLETLQQQSSLPQSESKKRLRPTHDYRTLSGKRQRRSSHRVSAANMDDSTTITISKEQSLSRSKSSYNTLPPVAQPASGSHSGFTPVNAVSAGASQRPSKTETPAPTQTLSLKDFNLSMRYRGKQWHFNSIAHKAKVLELILLKEEKDVESYPILAFSRGAKRAAFAREDDDDGDENLLKDYFRFYTHFMNERFPGNEQVLLENGVNPSA